MSEYIKGFIKLNKPQFSKYRKYTITNDWSTTSIDENLGDSFFIDYLSDDSKKVKKAEIEKYLKEKIAAQKSSIKFKSDEFKLQNDLMTYILDRLKVFCKKAEGDHHKAEFKKFIKECLNTISIHTDRVDIYVNSVDISQIENQEVRSEEMKFMKECFAGVTKIQDSINALNIKDETQDTTGIEFLNNAKAPLSMHKVLSEIYPEINVKLELLGIDFECDPGNDLHIYTENAPTWNPQKHYWEQEKDTLQYYVNEFKKLENGILVDNYYISGWMYYHMNVFVTPIPHKIFNEKSKQYESKDIIINPPLRDSDVLIFENYEKAKRNNILFTFIAATRRAAKTTLESSKLGHASTIGKKELLCAGGSTKDLNQIAKNFRTDIQYKNPAFAVYNVANDWKDKVEMGLKTKAAKTIILSTLYIVNTDGGNNVEILAGYTPDEFVYDEVMKGKFIEALQGLKPALKGADGLIRCFGLLSATGGDEELSRDGYIVLKDPEKNSVLPMDWDLLERGVPEECKTWKEDRNTPFGTFVPGQMCVDMPKVESTLDRYLQLNKCPNLAKIKIKITDWEQATERIRTARELLRGNRIAYNKEIVYIPIKPSEIFLSGKINPFPYEVATIHLERKRLAGDLGTKVDFSRNGSEITVDFSTKEIPPFPFTGGGFFDAPAIIFGGLPEEKPPVGLHCCGYDDYKQEQSGTDSLGCLVIFKRQSGGDPWGDRIAAILTTRPDPHRKFHLWTHMMAEKYNLEGSFLMENEDMEFKVYLDTIKETDKYLVPAFNVSADLTLKNSGRRQYGISPQGNKSAILNKAINYCNEIIVTHNDDGTTSQILGVERIDDEMLLEEIINYKDGENHDRITAFGIALIQAHKMDAEYVPVRLTEPKYEVQQQSNHNRSPIRMGRRSRSRL